MNQFFFWEFIPRKVVAPTLSKSAFRWKHGFHHKRSTLILGATAGGQLLKPTLILKQKTLFYLQTDNDISLYQCRSENGWINDDLIIKSIDSLLLPYIKEEHCLFLWDSFESHQSTKVLVHLQKYKHIHPVFLLMGTDCCKC